MDDRTDIPDVNADFAGARDAAIDWLVREAWSITNPQKLILEVCRRFVSAGMALRTFNVFIFTLHPDYFGVVHTWSHETGEVTSEMGQYEILDTDVVRQSPLQVMNEGAAGLRRRLDRPDFVADYPVLNDYRDAGATDYVLIRMDFSDRSAHCITMTSHRPGGFTTAELCLVSDLLPYMARLAEVQATRFLATTLLDTYVGKDAGARILVGNIRRGSGESVRAVIWFCDLRDFTVLSDAMTRDELIELLNDYFDCVGPPLRERGGEILKFIGDAMLGIFRVADADAERDACEKALATAETALGNLADLNKRRADAGKSSIGMGISLHVGEVMYGNIGTADRLDFTVIGPAVNLAARLDGLCRDLGEPIVISAEFARASGRDLRPLGRHALKGVAEPQDVFGPA